MKQVDNGDAKKWKILAAIFLATTIISASLAGYCVHRVVEESGFPPAGYTFDVAVSQEGYAFVVDGPMGMKVFKLNSDGTKMEPISFLFPPRGHYFRNIKIQGNYAFIADLEKGLAVVDVSNPALPKYIAQASWEGTAYIFSMGLESEKYLGDGTISKELLNIFANNGLSLVEDDIVVKENEDKWVIMENDEESYIIQKEGEKLNVYMVHDSAEIVRGEENFVYVAAGMQGLKVIDVSNPLEPEVISQFKYTNDACAEGLAVRDRVLYLANGNYTDPADSSLLIIDVSEPSSLKIVGKSSFSGWVEGVALFKDRGFVANTKEGTALIDISNIKKPLFLSKAP